MTGTFSGSSDEGADSFPGTPPTRHKPSVTFRPRQRPIIQVNPVKPVGMQKSESVKRSRDVSSHSAIVTSNNPIQREGKRRMSSDFTQSFAEGPINRGSDRPLWKEKTINLADSSSATTIKKTVPTAVSKVHFKDAPVIHEQRPSTEDDEILSGAIVSEYEAFVKSRLHIKKAKLQNSFNTVQAQERLRRMRKVHAQERKALRRRYELALEKVSMDLESLQKRQQKSLPLISKMMESILKRTKVVHKSLDLSQMKDDITSTVKELGQALESLDEKLTETNGAFKEELQSLVQNLEKSCVKEDKQQMQELVTTSSEAIQNLYKRLY